MIRAILLAQWRSMRSFQTRSFSASTAFSWISGILFYGFWAIAAAGAQVFFADPSNRSLFPAALPSALLFSLLYWQVTPVVTASMGASLDLKKLLAYPIPHGKLFLVELMLRVTVCLEMPMVLAGIALGLIRNPAIGGSFRPVVIIGCFLLFLVLNVLLATALRSLLERLGRRKRGKELVMFFFVALSILPQFLIASRTRIKALETASLPDAPYLPWSALSRVMLGSSYLLPLLAFSVALAAAWLFARSQFEKSLRTDGGSSTVMAGASQQPSPGGGAWLRWPAFLFPDPIAAIMEKEFRSLLRTPPFRFVLLMGAAFGLVLYVPRIIGGAEGRDSFLDRNLLTFCSVYAVLMLGGVSYFNSLGFDGSAAQAWFSFPVSFRKILVAKNLAAASFIAVELVLVTFITRALGFTMTPQSIVESALVALVAALYLIAFGNIASVAMPRAANAERISQAGSAKAKNLVILAVFPVILLPVGLAYWARSVFESTVAFFLLLGLAMMFGVVLYLIGLDSAVRRGLEQREKILSELSRGEGPLSSS